jgi:hypothetical protein
MVRGTHKFTQALDFIQYGFMEMDNFGFAQDLGGFRDKGSKRKVYQRIGW